MQRIAQAFDSRRFKKYQYSSPHLGMGISLDFILMKCGLFNDSPWRKSVQSIFGLMG